MQEAATPRPIASKDYPWYDSEWLSAYHRALAILRRVAPARVAEFEQAFDVLRTQPGFKAKVIERAFDEPTMDAIRKVVAGLTPEQLKPYEAREFRRFITHNHPFFDALHQRTIEWVSEAAGEPVEASYNFVSMYGPHGVCPLHLDAPLAKWTLDLCIDQSVPWPIHFAPVAHWPMPGVYGNDWQSQVKREVGDGFTTHTVSPGQAILFSGSSQWHYRDPMPGEGNQRSCDLLFMHFIPAGTAELAEPANWAGLFSVPELQYDGGYFLPRRAANPAVTRLK
ncbi:MAG: hypothetical protein ACAH21_15860 [Ramlibacter sp.]